MPLPVNVDATWLNPGSVSLNAAELRRADSALMGGDGSPLGVRGGIVRHGDTSLAVSVNASDIITVQPGAVVVPGNVGSGNGCYRTAMVAADTGTLTARNATNPRIDLVVFRVLDNDVVGTHGAFTGRVEVITGTPAASPVTPALPTLAVELARVTVPASAGGSATVDSSFRTYASAIGADLLVGSLARLPASTAKWQRAIALDTGTEYTWNGTAWVQGAWMPYTPLIGSGGVHGNAVSSGGSILIGKTRHFWGRVTLGSTSTVTGILEVTLPSTAKGAANYSTMQTIVTRSGVGSFSLIADMSSSLTRIRMWVPGGSGAFVSTSATVPFPWAANDVIEVHGTYEEA